MCSTLAVHAPAPAEGSSAADLLAIFRAHRARILLTYALLVGENLVGLAQPYCLGLAVAGLGIGSTAGLLSLAFQHLAATAIASARRVYDTRTFTAAYADLASRVIPDQRRREQHVSRVAARAAMSRELVDFFERDLSIGVQVGVSILGALGMLATYDVGLSAIALAAIVPSALLNHAYGRRASRFHAGLNDEIEREVAVIGRGEPGEVRSHFLRVAAWRVRLSDSQAINSAILEAALLAAMIASLARAGALADGDPGRIVAVFRYLMMFCVGLDGVPALVQQAGRLRDILGRLRSRDDGGDLAC
ncbi:ABC transporter six-transmembrane domain-containing protein [Aquisphaera insulae]|uniref:ABC transporter six-transmembrane domain-containing protein n=1 Tax=Aquisphaera insulae TaxID=2712864 RepID=UPI0013EDDD49|nr:ABC transporter six-transmembrane domain-containing protein [Aquisphaera insulae]